MKSFVKYGLGTGIVSGLWSLITFKVIGWLNDVAFHGSLPAANVRSIGGLFSIVILVLGIVWAIREVRRLNGGQLSYGQAVRTGVLVTCVVAGIVGAFTLLYCTVINPGFTDFMVADAERTLRAAGKTPDQIAPELVSVRKQFSIGAQVGQALIGQVVVGSIAALILGAFMRTKR
ncbi:hypothetical protein DCC81_11575 [Chitinophaga parva]|uniref:DUF4199 domain-containing protein n=1 Tax=Chitinophaga parva TaxID=2169414 RepID=A0A2T7BF89_9BACT|nr:DUF4199 domain-containing protein [Chitinophaga parva]PUZ24950.1 hypothetical protein DCC81_11575 [Chitinophaga parva]